MPVHHGQAIQPTRRSLLATSRALLLKDDGEQYPVRLLIDQGSELSFITEDLVRRSLLKRQTASLPLLGIGGNYAGRTRGTVVIKLQSIHDSMTECNLSAFILPRLTTKLPPYEMSTTVWPHLTGLQLADPEYSVPGPIHIIIGSDNYHAVIQEGLILGDSSSPTAQKTIFGWVLCGPISDNNSSFSALAHHCTPDQELRDLIARFWTLEESHTANEVVLNKDEESCERHFSKTHYRDATGRYVVRLPLKQSPDVLGESKNKALICFKRLEHQFLTKNEFKNLYVDFMEEYKRMGHMIEADITSDRNSPVHCLPHHGVLREHSTTTKLRVVFNGSSCTSSGLSLNDILYPGPKLQTEIADILLWIRTYKILFSADIVKMFRQVAVHKDDWDLQSIIWYGPEQQPITYNLTTVTYGLNCAPFLALRTLNQLVIDEGHRYPKAIVPMTKGRYVDDIFGGADSPIEAKAIIQQLIQLCEAGGFPLQKWSSNCFEVIPHNNEGIASEVEIEPTSRKILGLIWNPRSDTFHFSATIPTGDSFTKRLIASDIAKLYDPLGLISPVIIKAKIILQELWLLKSGWDDPLPVEVNEKWTTFRRDLLLLNQLSIPRWFGCVKSNASTIEIHGFSDASLQAMAAVVYIRMTGEDGEPHSQLISSKTKVAPLKRLTIPRLELTAALLLARLINHTLKILELSNVPVYCWSDSSVTLTWISAHPSRWKDYVRNRVSTIQEILPNGSWRHVPGKENPADLASRGLKPSQLFAQDMWWRGPKWLSASQECWPVTKYKAAPEARREERPGQVMLSVTCRPTYWNLVEKYSSLSKLLRVTAICNRFVLCLRKEPQSTLANRPITPTEIEHHLNLWVRIIQRYWFQDEIQLLLRGEQLKKSSSLIRLTPFVDRDGLLRVGGRLHYAQINVEAKHQLILPRKSPLTTLVIKDAHDRSLHGGTQLTLSLLREKFWVLGGRAPVRSFIIKCSRCARYRGVRAKQLMGQLPAVRVTPTRPFYHTGIDYAGPVSLKTWKGRAGRIYKGYLAIFVCMSTSAVHIEVVTDYTAEAFIAAYKRFTGRRGICATLNSDCGTNFIGADAELKRLFSQSSKELGDLASILANNGTEWKFNPPSAPHFGGKWEAAVKSVKFHMKRIIGEGTITYEEMTTIMVQIEAVLNSRPLCPLSDDPTDYSALTPGHFLIGSTLTAIPEPDLSTEPISRLNRWQLLRQRVEQFWTRWSSECLQRYQAISKWHHPTNEIKKGSLVLISDQRYPPGKWPLARVVELHPGPDGLTRVVTLRTSTSTCKRPVTKVCVLPTDPDSSYSPTPLAKAGGMLREHLPVPTTDQNSDSDSFKQGAPAALASCFQRCEAEVGSVMTK